MALPQDGRVTVDIEGVGSFDLVPSLKLARAVVARFGDPFKAIDALRATDPDAYAFVVHTASGGTGKPTEKMTEALFAAGVINYLNPLTMLLLSLANGGKLVSADADAEEPAEGSPGNG